MEKRDVNVKTMVHIEADADGHAEFSRKGEGIVIAKCLAAMLADVVMDCKEAGVDALYVVRQAFLVFCEEVGVRYEKNKEVKSNETKLIDGVTECCGYDFGTDYKSAKFCPLCGKEIVKKEGLE